MKSAILISLLVITSLTCNFSVDKSIVVMDGDVLEKSQNTMNGDIDVGLNSKVDGDCRSVNGCVSIQEFAKVHHVQTVNGNVDAGRRSKIEGNIESVHGRVHCREGVQVMGNVRTVEGNVCCEQTHIRGSIYTNTGQISLCDESFLDGNIIIQGGEHLMNPSETVEIIISDGSTVQGDVQVKDLHQRVVIFLSEDSHIEGSIQNAELIRMHPDQLGFLD